MFEITYNDYDALDYYVNERMAYENAEYDFTFENRYLVYHAPLLGYCIYFVLDMKTGLVTEKVYSERQYDALKNELGYVD